MKKTLAFLLISVFVSAGLWLFSYDPSEAPQSPRLGRQEPSKEAERESKRKRLAEDSWRVSLNEANGTQERLQRIQKAGVNASLSACAALDEIVGNPQKPLSERLQSAAALARIGEQRSFPGLLSALKSRSPILRLACADALVRTGEHDKGFEALFSLARFQETRRSAVLYLRRLTGESFSVDPEAGPSEAYLQVQKWELWWQNNKDTFSAPLLPPLLATRSR